MSRSTTNWIFVTPLVLVVMWLVPARLTGESLYTDRIVDLTGLFIIIVGLIIRVVARDWKAAHVKYGLVTTGPYSIVRHPMYVGSFLTGIGLCIILGNLYFGLAFSVVYIVLHAAVAKKEQRFLMKTWPDEFKRFKYSVPAYLPNPITLMKKIMTRKPWVTSKKAAIYRELGTICGFLTGAVLLEIREMLRAPIPGPRPWSYIHGCFGILIMILIVWALYTVFRPDKKYSNA